MKYSRPSWCVCAKGCKPCPYRGKDHCFHTDAQPYRFRTKKCRDNFDREHSK